MPEPAPIEVYKALADDTRYRLYRYLRLSGRPVSIGSSPRACRCTRTRSARISGRRRVSRRARSGAAPRWAARR